MPARPTSVPVTTGGATYDLTREGVEAAASRMLAVHQTAPGGAEWYVLVGSGLHYVSDVFAEATSGPRTRDVKSVRDALDLLGFPLFVRADRDLIDKGIPTHRG
ncbi:hypothetical protein [Streptomyces sp. NPDC002104]